MLANELPFLGLSLVITCAVPCRVVGALEHTGKWGRGLTDGLAAVSPVLCPEPKKVTGAYCGAQRELWAHATDPFTSVAWRSVFLKPIGARDPRLRSDDVGHTSDAESALVANVLRAWILCGHTISAPQQTPLCTLQRPEIRQFLFHCQRRPKSGTSKFCRSFASFHLRPPAARASVPSTPSQSGSTKREGSPMETREIVGAPAWVQRRATSE